MYIIKIGGSIITNKSDKQGFFKKSVMDELSKNIKNSEEKAIIIHGAGSFGHVLAKKHSLNDGFSNINQLKGFSMTQAKVQLLNTYVLDSLHQNNINAISIPPHTTFILDNHKLNWFNKDIFQSYIDLNFTPLTFGDVVLDKTLKFSICSGDLIILALTKAFKPKKVIFIIDEDGLYSSNPKIDKDAKFLKEVNLSDLNNLTITLDDHADVTKGMEGKINTIKQISQLNIDTIMLNGNKPDRLYDVLKENPTRCTLIHR
jgi:isopentenyl phosphate kinase